MNIYISGIYPDWHTKIGQLTQSFGMILKKKKKKKRSLEPCNKISVNRYKKYKQAKVFAMYRPSALLLASRASS